MEIIPAIIGKNIVEIKDKIDKIKGQTKWIQIDVMDGNFVPTRSWPYTTGDIEELALVDSIRKDDTKLEVHLMVENPEYVLEDWISFGADRIIFHYEATSNIKEIIETLEDEEIECGIALKMDTDVCVLDDFLGDFDLIQLMSIDEIGSYGKEFQESVIEKIIQLKETHPGIRISVDGGVSLENAQELIDVGAENLVVGSAIFNSEDIPKTILKFKKIIS
ncbi:MAG: ribulose-phosphate 3-epimerase [bacterium]